MNHTLQCNTIKKVIADQEQLTHNDSDEVDALLSKVEEIQIRIRLRELYLSQLNTQLQSLGEDAYSTDDIQQPLLSKETTFQIIARSVMSNGIQIKNIIEEYGTKGISTHGRIITEHIQSLISAGSVYQTNPDNQRGKRYKVVGKGGGNA